MTAVHTARAEPIEPSDVRALHLPWSSPFESHSLLEHVRAFPGRSFWVPQTGEYVIGEPWRHRDAITAVVDATVREHGDLLMESLRSDMMDRQHRLVVMTDFVGSRPAGFFARLGLNLIQEVICYELRAINPVLPNGLLQFQQVTTADMADLAQLIAVDNAAFPWLWWNSVEEFIAYERVPGVELYLGVTPDGTPMSYIGVTHFRGWGHLDRIAVLPGLQGTGYGLEALRFAIFVLVQAGATRIGLSTQANNIRSQRLYHRYGFKRTFQNDYNIYGTWVDAAHGRSDTLPLIGEDEANGG